MPLTTDLKSKLKKNNTFKKKPYRPWSIEDVSSPDKTNPKDNLNHLEHHNNDAHKNFTNLSTDQYTKMDLERIWRHLYGARKIILGLIIKNIEENSDNYVITTSITTRQLSLDSKLPLNTIKASLYSLKNNLLISTHETKPGIGGFARYRMSKDMYKFFCEKFSILD